MITLTLRQARAAVESGALQRLASERLPVKLAYWIGAKIVPAIDREFAATEKMRVELVQELGAQDDTGNWNVTPDNLVSFAERFNELLSESVEIEGRTYTPDELPDTVSLTPFDLLNLSWLIAEPQAASEPATVTPIDAVRAVAKG